MKNISLFFFYLLAIQSFAQTGDSITYAVQDFGLAPTGSKIYASWLFPCGQGAEYFRFQRSKDLTNVEEIGPKILALCNSNGYTRFDAVDTMPHYGVSYYRVLVEFAAGGKAASGWEEARFGDMENTYLLIKPNPVAEDKICRIHWILFERKSVFIEVLNAQGQVVETLANGNFLADTYNLEWNTAKLGRGLYFIKLLIGEKEYLEKVVL
jgi:hypothetical protein